MPRSIDLWAPSRLRLDAAAARDELRADIVRAALVEGSFVLSGGHRRRYYFDKYLFETRPAILRRVARFLADLVPAGTERLVAPALGAVALGAALSLEIGLPLVIMRMEPDREGAFEGELYARESVTVVEDVVASGTRALRAVSSVRAAGAQVRRVVAVLDRGEGAEDRLSEQAIDYAHLFTPEELGIERSRG